MLTQKKIRQIAFDRLGDMPAFNFVPKVKITDERDLNYCRLVKFQFDNKAGSEVYGYLIVPRNFNPALNYPAVQFIHWHAGQYSLGKDELFKVKSSNLLLRKLVSSGYLVFCIDSYCFGERRNIKIKNEELYLAKYNLLYGRTLWGMMLRDELLLLNYIKSLRFVDTGRIGVCGVSMGCTKSLWLASLEESYSSVAGILCTTRLNELIKQERLNFHGIYYYGFGMLKSFDTEILYSCIYPRNLLLINAEKDLWSPKEGVKYISNYLKKVYSKHLGRFKSIIYPRIGHEFNADMAKNIYEWFKRTL